MAVVISDLKNDIGSIKRRIKAIDDAMNDNATGAEDRLANLEAGLESIKEKLNKKINEQIEAAESVNHWSEEVENNSMSTVLEERIKRMEEALKKKVSLAKATIENMTITKTYAEMLDSGRRWMERPIHNSEKDTVTVTKENRNDGGHSKESTIWDLAARNIGLLKISVEDMAKSRRKILRNSITQSLRRLESQR